MLKPWIISGGRTPYNGCELKGERDILVDVVCIQVIAHGENESHAEREEAKPRNSATPHTIIQPLEVKGAARATTHILIKQTHTRPMRAPTKPRYPWIAPKRIDPEPT